jgi:hypothetical protein
MQWTQNSRIALLRVRERVFSFPPTVMNVCLIAIVPSSVVDFVSMMVGRVTPAAPQRAQF